MKEEYKRTFEALDDDKKWSLDDGTKVEDTMYAYGVICTYEQRQVLEICFTPSQLQQIKSANNKPLCEYDESCKNMFSMFSRIIKDAKNHEEELIDELWERLAEFGLISPRKFYNLHWLQRTMDYILDLYRFKVLEWVQKNGSETDFINRVWTILDQLFDDIMVETRRDNVSVATTFIDNEDRAVTGMAAIAAKVTSIRPDLVLYKNGFEYGVAECGKGDDEGIGKKEVEETNLHCPKVMKSMFLHTTSKCDNNEDVTRKLQIIGFSHFDLRMKVLVMDNPDGYVCRIRSTPQYKISTVPSNMLSGLLPILKLTLRSKLTVQSSIKLVHDYLISAEDNEPDLRDAMGGNKTRLVLPQLQRSPNKKPKNSKHYP
ncbi:hypothetical protein BDC45DRAFT_566159 [Circinella umbellata]|nr:hypothetical protein BDC45DRAFT_566159 [Circinella umbellata]